ncbi:hypothetical protein [Mesorhizobium sp.]|uniref:hypothetical protein n=1 Tax=Mesorhizobium sp. TaxID=1871066 RepID=UPI000FE63B3F|nr:hypothetical protein [Mesorhizobium sp.]RWO08248.1 MAG: hypothetical protein EOS15_30000 [Mesorhizobium sp.]
MRAIYPGHRYELNHLDGNGKSVLQFVQRSPLHVPMEGVTNQEVLRAVIDRVKSLDAEVPWAGNAQIIRHLRMAILLHESRAMERHIEKHDFAVEAVELGEDGHFKLQNMRAAA